MSAEKQGKLQLELLDVYGDRISGKTDIILRHQVLSDARIVDGVSASKKILVKDLYATPNGLYRVHADPLSYLSVGQFVNVKASGMTPVKITFPVDPKKVKNVQFPGYENLSLDLQKLLTDSDTVLGFEKKKGAELYEALDKIRKAGLLNIAKKASSTQLSNGKTVFPSVAKLVELRGDRFFAIVPKELREEVKNSKADGLFDDAPDILHHPPEGYTHAGSFKTPDHYGNLQLTFFAKGNDFVADVDIDDSAGLEHVFQVLRNALTGRPTHPYDIHEILVFYQKNDPGYRFILQEEA